MRHGYFVAAVVLVAGAAFAAAQSTDSRRDISSTNPWVIDDATCEIDVLQPDQSGVIVSIHDDHYDLQIYDTRLKGIVNGKVIKAKFSAGEPLATAKSYDARGVRERQSYAYVGSIYDDLLDRIGASNRLRVYRDGQLIADHDMTGFREAFAALTACGSNASKDLGMNAADAAMSDADFDPSAEAAAAAADAAAAPVEDFNPK